MAKSRATKGPFVSEGELWFAPLPKGGFAPIVVARTPPRDIPIPLVLCYAMPKRFDAVPRNASIAPLNEWEEVWVGWVVERPFKLKRWQRVGPLKGFDRTVWPVPPFGNCVDRDPKDAPDSAHAPTPASIEFNDDNGTPCVLKNVPCTQEQAESLPRNEQVTQASSLEDAIQRRIDGNTPCFHNMHAQWLKVSASTINDWKALRCTHLGAPSKSAMPTQWIARPPKMPPIVPGTIFTFPRMGGGFGVAVITQLNRAPDRGTVTFHCWLLNRLLESHDAPTRLDFSVSEAIADHALNSWPIAMGRWCVQGNIAGFNPADHPPPPHASVSFDEPEAPILTLRRNFDDGVHIPVQVDRGTVAFLDQELWLGASFSGYRVLELEAGQLIGSVLPPLTIGRKDWGPTRVTPGRIAFWKAIEQARVSQVAPDLCQLADDLRRSHRNI